MQRPKVYRDSDKCILNFLFLKIFLKFFKDIPLILNLGAPEELFLISTSLKFNFFQFQQL